MNCDVAQFEKQFLVAVGLEGHCRLYTLRYKVITPKVENEGEIMRFYLSVIFHLSSLLQKCIMYYSYWLCHAEFFTPK